MKNKLSEICFGITDGSHNPPKSGEKSEYLMLSSKNIYDDRITFEDPRYLSEEQFVFENRRTDIKPGDVLMTIVGTVGRTAVVREGTKPITLQRSVAVLHPNTDICSSRYLMYLLRSKRAFFEAEAHGVAQKGIYLKQLSDVKVAIPEIEKQHEVVAILDKISEVIHAREAEMVALDDIIKARFVEMFGDPVIGDKIKNNKRKIGDLASVTKLAGFEFTKYIQYKETGDIIMLRGLNCKNGHLVLDDIKWIDQETSDLLPRSKLYYGDILMTYAGTIGDVAMVDADDKYHLAPNVGKITIEDKENVNPIYLMHLFMFSHDYIMTFASQVAQASINMQKIRNFEYYFPQIEEQNQFAEFVAQVDKSKVVVQKALDETQLLFDSLMQQYFG